MTEIVLATMGPHLLVQEAFAGLAGVARLLIYGSWAARYHGEAGPPPNDLDVLLVGTPNRAEVYEAAEAVERRHRSADEADQGASADRGRADAVGAQPVSWEPGRQEVLAALRGPGPCPVASPVVLTVVAHSGRGEVHE